ncbi:hypothetical protein EGM51_12190 [Verrucomicrobia bacterium S94]|nr:hypothetical protein EGM51_12190 [Verrucomicrobia bacterium S94]
MDPMHNQKITERLKDELKTVARKNNREHTALEVKCAALTPEEAIGTPEEMDYPIQKGRETMLEVTFMQHRGQAFTREIVRDRSYTLAEVLELALDSDWKRAVLVATANAVFAHTGLIENTVHCRNRGPAECAGYLPGITMNEKVALFGLQPRFLEKLNALGSVRCVDIDPDLIGTTPSGIEIEPPEKTAELIAWADRILVTGSALVNDSFDRFIDTGKPTHVFGTTGAAVSYVCKLPRYCNADRVRAA